MIICKKTTNLFPISLLSRLQEDDNVDSLDLKLDKYESADRILHSKKNSYKVLYGENKDETSDTVESK